MPEELRPEIMPKNILMVGPTGVGKTEIARRLAKLAMSPFVKVEATKFTEVGFHGRDVETIVRDLTEAAYQLVKEIKTQELRDKIAPIVEDRLLELLVGDNDQQKEEFRSLLQSGALDSRSVELDVPLSSGQDSDPIDINVGGGQSFTVDPTEIMQRAGVGGGKGRRKPSDRRRVTVKEARPLLESEEMEMRLAAMDLKQAAVALAEEHGIVVIDEIDKIVSNKSKRHGSDASSEGVQRDLLPLIEGTTVEVRRFGNVRTDHVLFVCSGAFHESKPSDMLAEMQGRLPIRVELTGLTRNDLLRILTEPRANLIEQQTALIGAEGIKLEFLPEALEALADHAAEINRTVENIGARRLYTVVERVMEDLSFDASEMEPGTVVKIDKALVEQKLKNVLKARDLKKFIL